MSKINNGFVAQSSLFPQTLFTNSEVAATDIVRIQPRESSSSYLVSNSSSQTIRFSLPRNIFGVNMSTLKLRFDAFITGGTTPSFVNHICGVINRVRLVAGSKIILDEENFGLSEFLRYNLYANPAIIGNTSEAVGISSLATRQANAAGRSYIIYPFAFLASSVVIPYAMMNTDMYIEFVLESPNICVESATAVSSYTISNPVLLAESIIPTQKYRSELESLANAGQLRYPFVGHNYYIQPAVATNNNIRVPETCKSLKGVFSCMQLSTVTNDQTSLLKRNYNYNNTTQIQYKIDNTYNMPPDPIQCGGFAIEQYIYSAELYNGNNYDQYRYALYNSPALFVSTAFIPAFTFEKQSDLNDNLLSGYDLSKSAGGIQINIQLSSGVANNQLQLFTMYDMVLTISSGGEISILE